MRLLKALDPAQNILTRVNSVVDTVQELKDTFRLLSDDELKFKTRYFLKRIELGESIDDLLPEALATVREAAYRVHGLFAYPVQLVGALVIYEGNFAEMKTGEGKTLTIALSAYVASLDKQGVHIVTVNEYLVKRDAEFTRKILNFLGLTVGFTTSEMSKALKQKMFKCNVTYTTNSELAFDYLRDNMIDDPASLLIPELHFAIIDEGDSILIDEASTPLIISSSANKALEDYITIDFAIKDLQPSDYTVDWETKSVILLSSGISKIEQKLHITKLYSFENTETVNKVHNSLLANFVFSNGREYIIKEEKIMLVDQFTGRILRDRSYNNGLQQAIQAKEYLKIEQENRVAAKITYQSFFRLYKKLASLSGTALGESKELQETYNMIVVPVPTNKKIQRQDLPDIIFGSKKAKVKNIVNEVKKHYLKGQPVLIGSGSVSESELIYLELLKQKIPCEILNAKNHDREAEIISKAGTKHAVTIATNIAGRGVDIKLDEEVKTLGGLYVLGCEKNESKRVDDQLRGRSGRQGDPGKSIFFISLDDNIFKRFGADKFEKLSEKLKDECMESKFLIKTINNIQKRIQYAQFDARKNLIEYNELLSWQQNIIYRQRRFVLINKNNCVVVKRLIEKVGKDIIKKYVDPNDKHIINAEKIAEYLNWFVFSYPVFESRDFVNKDGAWIYWFITNVCLKAFEEKREKLKDFNLEAAIREIVVNNIDAQWQDHLEMTEKIKNNINLRSMEQKSPLNVYVEKVGELFSEMLTIVREKILQDVMNLPNSFVQDTCYKYSKELLEIEKPKLH